MQDIRNKMLEDIKSIFDKAAFQNAYNVAINTAPTMYWNGTPCRFDVVDIKILESDNDPIKMPWYKAFEGQERQAIMVHTEGQSFLIDNEDGSGWIKIRNGSGMWTSPHRSFGNTETIGIVHPLHWNKVLDHCKKALTEKTESEYWQEHNPEGWAEHQKVLNIFQKPWWKQTLFDYREEEKTAPIKLNRAQRRAEKFKK